MAKQKDSCLAPGPEGGDSVGSVGYPDGWTVGHDEVALCEEAY